MLIFEKKSKPITRFALMIFLFFIFWAVQAPKTEAAKTCIRAADGSCGYANSGNEDDWVCVINSVPAPATITGTPVSYCADPATHTACQINSCPSDFTVANGADYRSSCTITGFYRARNDVDWAMWGAWDPVKSRCIECADAVTGVYAPFGKARTELNVLYIQAGGCPDPDDLHCPADSPGDKRFNLACGGGTHTYPDPGCGGLLPGDKGGCTGGDSCWNGLCTPPPPPVCNGFSASKTQIASGESVTLSWNIANAIGASIDNGSSDTPIPSSSLPAGSMSFSPTATTTYNLDVINLGGASVPNLCSPVTVTVCAANFNQDCSATNGCNVNPGHYKCDGTCDAAPPPSPSSCTKNNACGEITIGEICSGVCNAPEPPVPAACTKDNHCGGITNGLVCNGVCNAPEPPTPQPCTKTNACNETTAGNFCNGACQAPEPPVPAACSPSNICGDTNSGLVCGGKCNVSAPPDPPGVGQPCTVTNACGISAVGITQCNGSCDAETPAVVTGGLIPCGRYCDDPATAWDDRSPCSVCFMVQLLKNIVDFITLKVGIPIALFIMIVSGLLYATSTGNQGRMEFARSAIVKTLAGLAIIFIAWLFINTVLVILGYVDSSSWSMINCSL